MTHTNPDSDIEEVRQYFESTFQDGAVMATRPNSGYHKRVDEFTDKIMQLKHQWQIQSRLDEIKETILSAAQFGVDHQYSDYPFYVIEKPDVDKSIAQLEALLTNPDTKKGE